MKLNKIEWTLICLNLLALDTLLLVLAKKYLGISERFFMIACTFGGSAVSAIFQGKVMAKKEE